MAALPEHDHLAAMLTRLKLTAVRDQLDSLLDEATRRDLTLRDSLALLCEREIARKDSRRVEMAINVGYTVLFVSAPTLVAQLAKAHAEGRLDERLLHFGKPRLLIIDA